MTYPARRSWPKTYWRDLDCIIELHGSDVSRSAISAWALFGFSKLYGQVPGGQAEHLRASQAQFTHIEVPAGPQDERFATTDCP